MPLFSPRPLDAGENGIWNIVRISNRYALCYDDTGCKALLPIRSNHDDVREFINVLKNHGCVMELDKFMIKESKENNDLQSESDYDR